jgi:NADH:ubiquinone oxidoreductase subunit 3 (subunit A)
MMLDQWLFIALLLPIGVIFGALPIVAAQVLAPRKPNLAKQSTYECGVETVGPTWVQFKVQYYIYALIFVIFDIEAVFLFPWAVAYQQLQLYMVMEGVLFILILAGGLLYAWRKGALEWL